MTARSRQTGVIGAILIALIFVVQTFGSAYAIGLGGRSVALDAFGNPLCITSGTHDGNGDAGKHGLLKDCCELPCAGIANTLAAPPDRLATRLPVNRLLTPLTRRPFEPLPVPVEFSPGHPRAPPTAV